MSRIEVQFQADSLRHQLIEFIKLVEDHSEIKSSVYEDELEALIKSKNTLDKIVQICKR